jgi:hypothetical protein
VVVVSSITGGTGATDGVAAIVADGGIAVYCAAIDGAKRFSMNALIPAKAFGRRGVGI